MQVVFVDTGFWIAIANPRDHLHRRASSLSKEIGHCRMVTSELVLIELLNGFADSGARLRSKAIEMVQAVLDDSDIDLIPQTGELFRDALALYRERSDKSWSMTDCVSFLIMERQRIVDALTHDRHFEQRGYRALLRD